MKTTNKILSIILAILMVMSIIPITASAETITGTCGDNLTWTFDNSTGTLTISGTGAMYDFSYSGSNSVPWGTYRRSVKTVVINEGVTTIGNYAFYSFEALTDITIPDSVTAIGKSTFYGGYGLKEVKIPDFVTTIGDSAFSDCVYLEKINIPENVTEIGNYAFNSCVSLETVIIPDSVITLGERAFARCFGLTSVTIGEGITLISNELFRECKGITSITIPDSVASIGNNAFASCEALTEVAIGKGVISIGDNAFGNCSSIESITLPNGTTTIGNKAFYNCSGLKKVVIPESVTSIGEQAFLGCRNLTNTVVDSNNQYYSSDEYGVLFNKDKTTLIQYLGDNTRASYAIPDSVTIVGSYAFNNSDNLENITIPDSVTTISEYAFADCDKLASVILPNRVTKISWFAFSGCSNLSSITLPNELTTISTQAFNHCSALTSITIPDSVTTIADFAFEGCYYLLSVTIGSGLQKIGSCAFRQCNSLVDVFYSGTEEQWNNISIGSSNNPLTGATKYFEYESNVSVSGECGDNLSWEYTFSSGKLTIFGDGAMPDYETNNRPWEKYKNHIKEIVVSDGVTTIGANAFYKCIQVTSVTLADGLTTIGKSAFYDCRSITSISLPDSVTSLGASAFALCYSLTDIKISNNVTIIPERFLASCKALTEVTIPENVVEIGSYAFAYCELLTKILVDENNLYYSNDEYGVLFDKDKTTIIQYPRGRTDNEYSIPDGVTIIEDCDLSYCESLKSIRIPASVTTIDKYAFTDYTKILYYDGTEEQWKQLLANNSDAEDLIYFTVHCSDNSIYPSGKCGEKLIWTFDNATGTLTVSGEGYMDNYEFSDCYGTGTAPWDVFSWLYIKHVVINDGVLSIGAAAFTASDLETVTMSNTVSLVGNRAFDSCDCLTDVYYLGTESEWDVIEIKNKNSDLLNADIHFAEPEHTHDYKTVVTAPTCTEQGYTTYTCECNDSYVDDYVNASGHSYTSEITTPATHTETGVMTYTCDCGDTYTETIEKIEKHNYEAVVTTPNCTEQGYTTYTCECGDNYVGDYVDALGHTEEIIPAVAPTCTETGLTEGIECSVCGETLTEQKTVDALGHTPANAVEENYVAPTCTENGSKDVVVYCSVCNEEISRETIVLNATGHDDSNNDGYCDSCDEQICDHRCHKSGFAGFFWKITLLFNKLFKTNKYCSCGIEHY